MSASINNYISVVQSPTADNSGMTITLKSVNRSPSVSVATTVTGLMKSDSPEDVIGKIKTALDAQLTASNAKYSGQPDFQVNVQGSFTFKTYQTEHTLCIWSQAPYQLTVSSDTSGCSTLVDDIPLLMTIPQMEKIAPRLGVDLSNMTDPDKIQLLIIISQQVISWIGYVPTATVYLHEARTFYQNGTSLDRTPVIEHDPPAIRSSNPVESLIATSEQVKSQFDLNYQTGVLTFSDYGILYSQSMRRRPLDYNNFLRMTYVAGHIHIPPIVKTEALKLANVISTRPNVSRLKIGTFQVDYRENREYINEIRTNILGMM